MNTGSELVIYQAKAAISKACEGRKCLADCLRRIERAEVGKLPPAPSAAQGAKAAKRTPDAMRVHPAARVRAVAGAARAAWRAFAFLARSARGRVAVMLRALSARLSAILRPGIRAIAAVALTLGVTCPAMRAVGATCTWNGTGYTCDGSGSILVVNGGGGDGSGGPVIITNMVGTCTNCVAMSPDYVRQFRQEAYAIWEEINTDVNMIAQYYAPFAIEILAPYAERYPVAGFEKASASRLAITNFVESTPGVIGSKPYNAADSVCSSFSPLGPVGELRRWISAYDGAAIAYNDVAGAVIDATNTIFTIQRNAYQVQIRVYQLQTMIMSLSDEACTAQYNGPATSGPGSGIVTNQATGDWCTYEQGNMIIDTLKSIDEWFDEQERYLKSITNWIALVNTTIVANLNTSYSAIPSAENLGGDWRDVYLAGQRTQWGYEPTNILARVELLLYGLSGVGTNSTDVADETGIYPTDADTAGDDYSASLEDFAIDGSIPAQDLGTISEALGRFYARFSALTGSQFAGQQVSASYSVEIGEQRYDVPAFQLDTQHSRIANTAQLMCKSFLVILYLLAAAYAGFRFYAVFLAFVLKYSKWAQELLSSLFAD